MRNLLTFVLTLTCSTMAIQAQQTPSMNPGEEAPKAKNPFGVELLSGDRPEGAVTVITAQKEATFDNAKSVAEFLGSVVVKDPQFTLYCQRLRVTLDENRRGLKLVEAFGKVVIVQEGEGEAGDKVKSIGRAQKAVYDPATGEAVLSVWPSVQHGINNQVATEQGTIMKLNRNGKSQTIGGSKTVIVDSAGSAL